MRLIDADKFKQEIAAFMVRDNLDVEKCNAMRELIDKQPTAFDVDKVIEKMQEMNNSAKAKAEEYDESGRLDLMDVYDAKAEAYRNSRRIIKSELNQ